MLDETNFGFGTLDMRYISATEAKQSLGAVIDGAQREPVVIRKQNRNVAVVLSMNDYERLTTSRIGEFKRFCDDIAERAKRRGLTEAALGELLADDR